MISQSVSYHRHRFIEYAQRLDRRDRLFTRKNIHAGPGPNYTLRTGHHNGKGKVTPGPVVTQVIRTMVMQPYAGPARCKQKLIRESARRNKNVCRIPDSNRGLGMTRRIDVHT